MSQWLYNPHRHETPAKQSATWERGVDDGRSGPPVWVASEDPQDAPRSLATTRSLAARCAHVSADASCAALPVLATPIPAIDFPASNHRALGPSWLCPRRYRPPPALPSHDAHPIGHARHAPPASHHVSRPTSAFPRAAERSLLGGLTAPPVPGASTIGSDPQFCRVSKNEKVTTPAPAWLPESGHGFRRTSPRASPHWPPALHLSALG
ncbi:hypothetical protein RhiLY_05682 [Ceratobasidium sp. AG-Ba]|nr:hypothetical protein RhiLY_05682 [Ceratobasidium sp. AG-Ba]